MSLKKWLPLVRQLTFGWDTCIGLGLFVLFSLVNHQPARISVLLLAGFCAYVPDIDFIPFLLLRKRLNVTVGHWVFGHFPIIVLPIVAGSVWLLSGVMLPEHRLFLTLLCVTATTCHFIHDTIATKGGFHLFAPFTGNGKIRFTLSEPWIWTHYNMGWFGMRKTPNAEVSGLYELTRKWAHRGDGGNEVTARVEVTTLGQMMTFALCCIGFIILVIKSGISIT